VEKKDVGMNLLEREANKGKQKGRRFSQEGKAPRSFLVHGTAGLTRGEGVTITVEGATISWGEEDIWRSRILGEAGR